MILSTSSPANSPLQLSGKAKCQRYVNLINNMTLYVFFWYNADAFTYRTTSAMSRWTVCWPRMLLAILPSVFLLRVISSSKMYAMSSTKRNVSCSPRTTVNCFKISFGRLPTSPVLGSLDLNLPLTRLLPNSTGTKHSTDYDLWELWSYPTGSSGSSVSCW